MQRNGSVKRGRPDPLQGLEKRHGADGKLIGLRAEVRIPGTKKKKRGPWRSGPGMVAEARSDRAKLLASQEALAEQAAAPTFPTVEDAVEAFLSGAEAGRPWARGGKTYDPKTLRGYRQDAANWIRPTLGPVPVDRLRRSQIQALIDEVELLRSGQTARKVVTVLQALYRHLLPRHDELTDPTVGLELPSGSQPRNVIVTPSEMGALVEALAVADRAAFGLAGLAGLRAGELKGLQVEDVALDLPPYREGAAVEDCAHVVVRAGWDEVEGRKGAKHRDASEARMVPIFAPLLPLLERQLASLGPAVRSDYPFLPGVGAQGSRIGRGLPLDTDGLLTRCRRAWGFVTTSEDPRKLKAGPEALAPDGFRLHDARHSFASALIVAGFDVATVSEWIGHRQASTTLDRYVKPLRKRGVRPEEVRAWLVAA